VPHSRGSEIRDDPINKGIIQYDIGKKSYSMYHRRWLSEERHQN
jgi:hypothetical protein